MKRYIIMHKVDWSEKNIEDMVNVYINHYSVTPETYYNPTEENLNYDYEVDKEFENVVKIAEFSYFDGDEENPFAVAVNDWTYCFNQKPEWLDLLRSLGWDFFYSLSLGDKDYDSKDEAEKAIQNWTAEIANEKVNNYIANGEY